MLLEHVLQVGTAFVSVRDLLLKHRVLLVIDVVDDVLGIGLKVVLELFILGLLPVIKLLLLVLVVFISLLLLVLRLRLLVAVFGVESVHIVLVFLFELLAVNTLQNAFIGAEHLL